MHALTEESKISDLKESIKEPENRVKELDEWMEKHKDSSQFHIYTEQRRNYDFDLLEYNRQLEELQQQVTN